MISSVISLIGGLFDIKPPRVYPGGLSFKYKPVGTSNVISNGFDYFFAEYAQSIEILKRKATYEEMVECVRSIENQNRHIYPILGALIAINFFRTKDEIYKFCSTFLICVDEELFNVLFDIFAPLEFLLSDYNIQESRHILQKYYGQFNLPIFLKSLKALVNLGMHTDFNEKFNYKNKPLPEGVVQEASNNLSSMILRLVIRYNYCVADIDFNQIYIFIGEICPLYQIREQLDRLQLVMLLWCVAGHRSMEAYMLVESYHQLWLFLKNRTLFDLLLSSKIIK